MFILFTVNRPLTPENTAPPDGSNDVSPPHPGFGSAPDLSSGDAADSDSEYVYDVYYRDADTTSALASTGDGLDVGGASGFERIAALSVCLCLIWIMTLTEITPVPQYGTGRG